MKYLIFYNGNNVVLGIHNAPMLESFGIGSIFIEGTKYFILRMKSFFQKCDASTNHFDDCLWINFLDRFGLGIALFIKFRSSPKLRKSKRPTPYFARSPLPSQ